MNYQKIYNNIIKRGQDRIFEAGEYYEIHHIFPKCMGGLNNSENLVKLTAKEHFLCHWLLCRIYPEVIKLSQAFWIMCHSSYKKELIYKFTARTYEEARILHSKNHKKWWQNLSKEKREEISIKIGLANKDKHPWTEKRKENYSKIMSKPVLQIDPITLKIIKEWPSVAEAKRFMEGDIYGCVLGYQFIAGKFRWEYKNEKDKKPIYIKKDIDREIYQIDIKTNEIIKIWDYPNLIKKELGWDIFFVLTGKSKTGIMYGYKWKYKKDYIEEKLKI